MSFLGVLTFALMMACSGKIVAPTPDGNAQAPIITDVRFAPRCQAGCTGPGPDPSPSAPGEWVGSDFSDDICIGGSSDLDGDGLGDLCELRLVESFAPEMVTWSRHDGGTAENIGGERYWAARYVEESSPFTGMVMLVYLPAYYADLGDPESGLTAHPGDSEIVVLYVKYNPSTQHWVLKAAHLSHHTTYGYEGSNFGNPNSSATMEYPERIGGYPRVWVAKFKHANYSTRAKCTAGGFGGLDHCDTYQYSAKWRFPVYSHHNLGSYSTRFIDCVDAEFQVGEHMECMWATSGKFRGWLYHPDQMLGGDQHGAKLQVFGFLN